MKKKTRREPIVWYRSGHGMFTRFSDPLWSIRGRLYSNPSKASVERLRAVLFARYGYAEYSIARNQSEWFERE